MLKLTFSTITVLIATLLITLPQVVSASNGSFVGGSVDIANTWGRIGSVTSSTPIGSVTVGGGKIGNLPAGKLVVTINVVLIPAGKGLNFKGRICSGQSRVTAANPLITIVCKPPLPAGSYDIYMLAKDGGSNATYDFNTDSSILCSAPGGNDEGTGDSDFRNPVVTTAVIGGNGFLNHGDVVTVEVKERHCDVHVLTRLSLIADQTGPDSFSFTADPANSNVDTIYFKKKGRVSFVPCASMSLPVGHGVNDLINARFTLGVTAECTLGGSVDMPKTIAVEKSTAIWINTVAGQSLPTASVGTTVNGGIDTCKNHK